MMVVKKRSMRISTRNHKGQVLVEGSSEFLANDPKAREIYLGPEFNL